MANKKIFNPSKTKSQRKYLRNNITAPEVKLWAELKNLQVLGIKFRRQHGIECYIVDFYSPSLKRDRNRDQYLTELGLTVMRFTNTEVSENIDGGLTAIYRLVSKLKS